MASSRRGWVVTVRHGPKLDRVRFGDLDAALDELEVRARALQQEPASAVDMKFRRVEPVQRVVARVELAGPGRLRAGVDVRGDGSAESYTGRIRRRLLAQAGGESAYDALRRELRAR